MGDPAFGARQPSFPFQRVVPPLAQAYSLPTTLNASTAEQLTPVITAAGRIINLPKRFHVDKNKLMASVCAKTGPVSGKSSHDRIVLRYTDGGIQKPELTQTTRASGVAGATQSFPKMISRYVSKHSSKNSSGGGILSEAYKTNPSNLSVVSQSFI